MPTISVKDSAGADQTIAKVANTGQAAMADSLPVVIASNQSAVPVSGTVAVTGVATEATLAAGLGSLTETAPVTDTASSGNNGRLQRIAQRITSLITALGSPFQAGGSIGNTTFGATQSGAWTVQPGNTANTTAWKVDGSAVTQPVSAAALPLPSGAATAAKQPALGTAGTASADVVTIQGAASMTPVAVSGTVAVTGAGDASAANQATGNASVASIDTKTPALGQALAAASTPVVLTAAQITTLTPPAAITGFSTAAKQPALGTAGTASADVLSVQGVASMTPLLVAPPIPTLTNISGTITTGATAQNAAASNAARKGYSLQNQSSGNIWFSTLATAVASQPSFLLAPGAFYETPPGGQGTGAISVIGATTGQAWAGREW